MALSSKGVTVKSNLDSLARSTIGDVKTRNFESDTELSVYIAGMITVLESLKSKLK